MELLDNMEMGDKDRLLDHKSVHCLLVLPDKHRIEKYLQDYSILLQDSKGLICND